MLGKEPDRKPSFCRLVVAVVLASFFAGAAPACAAEGLWDTVLEKMNIKAAPAAPGPDFIERTRPDPGELGYLPTALPHKVSPRPVKTPDEIQAQKDALDAAKQRQLDPNAPKPLGTGKKPAAKAAKASAGTD
jgi:hypothetical protein